MAALRVHDLADRLVHGRERILRRDMQESETLAAVVGELLLDDKSGRDFISLIIIAVLIETVQLGTLMDRMRDRGNDQMEQCILEFRVPGI